MRKYWIGLFGILATAFAAMPTAEAVVPACVNPPFTFTVTSANASDIASGYNCDKANLVITGATIPITAGLTTYAIQARSITVTNSTIENSNPGSKVNLTATGASSPPDPGNITFNGAIIHAHAEINIKCNQATCTFTSDNSEIWSDFPSPGKTTGSIRIDAGIVDIDTTSLDGGGILEIEAHTGDLTIHGCGTSGTPDCKSPLERKPPPAIVASCFDAAGNFVPCTINFTTKEQLESVCIKTNTGPLCDGGHVQKHFIAKGDIHIEGIILTSVDHMTFLSRDGKIFAAGSTISSEDALDVTAKLAVDFTGATWTAGEHFTVFVNGCDSTSPQPCINATNAKLTGNSLNLGTKGNSGTIVLCGGTFEATSTGPAIPTFNGKGSFPYPATVTCASTAINTVCPTPSATESCIR